MNSTAKQGNGGGGSSATSPQDQALSARFDQIGHVEAQREFSALVEPLQCAATPAELAESRLRCWYTGCDRMARLDWCGWRYCLPHYWTQVLRDTPARHWWVKLRYTRLALRRGR